MKDGNFTGIAGIPNQDIAMWEGMGPISDRSAERLGASDVAVAAFRRLMVEAARAMRDSGEAIGTAEPHVAHATICSFEGVVPKTDELAHARRRQRKRSAGDADHRGGVTPRWDLATVKRSTTLQKTS